MAMSEGIDMLDDYEACAVLLRLIFTKTDMRDIVVPFTPKKTGRMHGYRRGCIPALIQRMHNANVKLSSVMYEAEFELSKLAYHAQEQEANNDSE